MIREGPKSVAEKFCGQNDWSNKVRQNWSDRTCWTKTDQMSEGLKRNVSSNSS